MTILVLQNIAVWKNSLYSKNLLHKIDMFSSQSNPYKKTSTD